MNNAKLNSKVLIIDSGIGGMPILFECLKKEKKLDYIYFADYKSMPYGNKPLAVLRKTILQNILTLNKKYNPAVIVLACNTATAVSISVLRRALPNKIIIGTEPALKVATKNGKRNILLLATQNTIKYNKLIQQYKDNKDINLILRPMPTLAKNIENSINNLNVLKQQIVSIISEYEGYIDCVVLGCTHYIFIRDFIAQNFNVPVYDGNFGVVNQILNKAQPKNKNGKIIVLTNEFSKSTNLLTAWQILQKREV
ncbi:MAG: aspartate/glutamate racemase family protein [Clostridia bacterium]|nr:aspartate/glutamate racemase family protein [Clostridia bacterium]